MKILRQGQVPADRANWWLFVRFECHCGAVFQLDQGEKPDRVITERRPNGESVATVKCPTCDIDVSVHRSGMRLPVHQHGFYGLVEDLFQAAIELTDDTPRTERLLAALEKLSTRGGALPEFWQWRVSHQE